MNSGLESRLQPARGPHALRITHHALSHPSPRPLNSGFTLLEVVLAISIAIGVLVVALYFYAQAAELRTQLLLESERISSARRIMDRITEDLRCACGTFAAGGGVTGDSASLRIVRTELTPRSLWTAEQAARAAQPVTDLRLVIYSTGLSTNGTNVVDTTNAALAGLFRSEEPLVQKRQTRPPRGAAPPLSATPPETKPGPEPLTEAIQFVNLRYWDGSSWQDSWNKGVLPQGVEVSLGGEPLPDDLLPNDYPFEVFRRTIYLPTSVASRAPAVPADTLGKTSPSTEVAP